MTPRWLMRADNSGHVIDAARRRSQATQQRAVAALRRMDNAGIAVSFESVAKEAGVSRSWLYTQPTCVPRSNVSGNGSVPRLAASSPTDNALRTHL